MTAMPRPGPGPWPGGETLTSLRSQSGGFGTRLVFSESSIRFYVLGPLLDFSTHPFGFSGLLGHLISNHTDT